MIFHSSLLTDISESFIVGFPDPPLGCLWLFYQRKWKRILVFNPWYLLSLPLCLIEAHGSTSSLLPHKLPKAHRAWSSVSSGLCLNQLSIQGPPPWVLHTHCIGLCPPVPVSGSAAITAGVGHTPCGRGFWHLCVCSPHLPLKEFPIFNKACGGPE